MDNNEVVNAQPDLLDLLDDTKSYMYEKLWNLCAGPLCNLQKLGEKVYYFPQGHIELIEASTRGELDQMRPIFNLPSKLRCRVIAIQRKVDQKTDEVYAEISLMPDTTQVIIPTPNGNEHMPIVKSFTKVLTPSDTSTHGGFSVPKKHAIDCLPPLDMAQPIPTQELVAKDINGHVWRFKHSFRGTPRRHIFTTGWSAFATAKRVGTGDSFLFLRGETGELRVGIRRSGHQQGNIPSSLISTQSIKHGVIASAVHAFDNQCMFVVVYKPRSSQFVVGYEKFVDAVNNKFNVGSRFMMRFEGEDFSVRRYSGTVIGINDFSPYWKESEWRSLQVQWDELASFSRPDKVSPWEIEHLAPSSNVLQSNLLKNKRSRQYNEIGSTSSDLWNPTLIKGQENGQPSMSSSLNVPQLNCRDAIEDSKISSSWLMSYSVPTMPKPNYNNDQIVKEKITIDATTSCRLFGVDLTTPSETKDSTGPIDSYRKYEISKLSQEKKLDQTKTLTSPKEIQSKQSSSTRSCTKVQMQGVAIGKAVDLSILDGYNHLIHELEKIFDLKSKLRTRNQWEIVFTDNEGDMMLVGDDPWPEFCNMVKKIYICSKEEVKKVKSVNVFSQTESRILTSSNIPP